MQAKSNETFLEEELRYWNASLPWMEFLQAIGCRVQYNPGNLKILHQDFLGHWETRNDDHGKIMAEEYNERCQLIGQGDLIDLCGWIYARLPKTAEELERDRKGEGFYRPIASESKARLKAREFIRRTAFQHFRIQFDFHHHQTEVCK